MRCRMQAQSDSRLAAEHDWQSRSGKRLAIPLSQENDWQSHSRPTALVPQDQFATNARAANVRRVRPEERDLGIAPAAFSALDLQIRHRRHHEVALGHARLRIWLVDFGQCSDN